MMPVWGCARLDDIEVLIAFFEARQGPDQRLSLERLVRLQILPPQRLNRIFATKSLRTGDGVDPRVPADQEAIALAAQIYQRPITKPVAGTVRLGLGQEELHEETIDFNLDTTTGLAGNSEPPAGAGNIEVVAGFEFDVPVRFDTDRIQTSVASFQAGDVPAMCRWSRCGSDGGTQ